MGAFEPTFVLRETPDSREPVFVNARKGILVSEHPAKNYHSENDRESDHLLAIG